MSIKQVLSLGLRLSVSIVFLAYLFAAVPWEQVWLHFRRADLLYFSLYIALGLASILVSSMKWLVLARAHRMSPKLSFLVGLYMVGYFFNNFLPTSIGGDVVRGHALGTAYGKKAEAMASVVVERLTGYTALIFLALLALAFDGTLRANVRVVMAIVIALLAYLCIVFALLSSKWLQVGSKWMPTTVGQKWLQKIGMFQNAIQMYKDRRAVLLVAGAYSILFYVVSVAIVYVGCLTFGATVPVASLITAVPVLLILLMIPFSLGGIGIQEWAFFFVLQAVGVPATIAVSMGLLFRTRAIAFALVGGILYPLVTRGGLRPEKECFPILHK